ncbi:DNA polymerase III subunit alpha, partial [Desulfobacteraceae bacterium SEEP-SAG9]
AFNPGGSRAELLWALALWRKSRPARSAHRNLFDSIPDVRDGRLPPLPPENERQRLRREFAVLGFLCDRHPVVLYKEVLKDIRRVKAVHLRRFIGKQVRLAGWLLTGKVVRTKQGDPMEFLTFEDETGIVETVFFPKTYHRFCHMIDRGRPYRLTGKVEEDWGAITLTVEKVEAISSRHLSIASL